MHKPWLLPWPEPVPAGPCSPCRGRQPWDKARAGQHQAQPLLPVPVGCGLSHRVCGCVISKTLISPGSVTEGVIHRPGCLSWGLDFHRDPWDGSNSKGRSECSWALSGRAALGAPLQSSSAALPCALVQRRKEVWICLSGSPHGCSQPSARLAHAGSPADPLPCGVPATFSLYLCWE